MVIMIPGFIIRKMVDGGIENKIDLQNVSQNLENNGKHFIYLKINVHFFIRNHIKIFKNDIERKYIKL